MRRMAALGVIVGAAAILKKKIFKIAAGTTTPVQFTTTGVALPQPMGLTIDPAGVLYLVADSGVIYSITNGVVALFANPGSFSVDRVRGVVRTRESNLYAFCSATRSRSMAR